MTIMINIQKIRWGDQPTKNDSVSILIVENENEIVNTYPC